MSELTPGEAIAVGRWRPDCVCGGKATHACSYCGGVCDWCIEHCFEFGHVWLPFAGALVVEGGQS